MSVNLTNVGCTVDLRLDYKLRLMWAHVSALRAVSPVAELLVIIFVVVKTIAYMRQLFRHGVQSGYTQQFVAA